MMKVASSFKLSNELVLLMYVRSNRLANVSRLACSNFPGLREAKLSENSPEQMTLLIPHKYF